MRLRFNLKEEEEEKEEEKVEEEEEDNLVQKSPHNMVNASFHGYSEDHLLF